MSIIADTLKRLQAQADDSSPKPTEDSTQRPTFNKGEGSGRHRKDSPFTFLMVLVGMTLTLGGLAVATFWIGGHLDFGMGTPSQARVSDNYSTLLTPNPSNDIVILEQTMEPPDAADQDPIPLPQSSATPTNTESHQTAKPLETTSTSLPASSSPENTTPTPLEIESNNLPPSEAMVQAPPHALETSPDTIAQALSNQEKSKDHRQSSSDSPTFLSSTTESSTSPTEESSTNIDFVDQIDEPETSNVVAMLSEEEIIQTDTFVKTSGPVTDSSEESTTLVALKAQRESLHHEGIPLAPLQPSPTNRLSHAQEMIRAGEYEDAAALLSPLFHDPPAQWQPWFWMGTALLGKGDMAEADQFFLSGLARNDKIPQLWIQRALVAQQRGDYQLAIHELRQAESLAADLPHIHLNMGYAYEQLGNDQMANQYYGKFLKLSEDQPSFFSTRKKLFARLTQHTAAEKKPFSSPPPSKP